MIRRQSPYGTIYLLKDDSVQVKETAVQQQMLGAAAQVYAATKQPLVVTSGNDGRHMRGSKHYDDKALDFRVWGLEDHEAVASDLQALLGDDYDVIAEWRAEGDGEVPSHIHVEHDPA